MSRIATRQLQGDERKAFEAFWRTARPLSLMLPYRTHSGFVVEHIDLYCSVCDKPIPTSAVRAKFYRHAGKIDEFVAFGVCCKTATPYKFRFLKDGRMTALVHHQWQECHTTVALPSWWDLIGWWRVCQSWIARNWFAP